MESSWPRKSGTPADGTSTRTSRWQERWRNLRRRYRVS
uniref:Uncharacterized protein n=1 Tax=Rhizophora mucronata TaxID=61149 RepID=A0A2P2PNE1_RHIMU